MKHMLSLAAAVAAGVALAAPPVPKDSPEYRKAKELVEQLGSKKYREREKAAAELVKMGRAAKDALSEGKKSADTEVSDRCTQLLPQALALDLAFRVDRFLKDTDGNLDHDLPLWKTYRDKIGSTANDRKLYAEMIKTNGALLEAVEEEPDRLAERISLRVMEIYQALYGNAFGGGFRGGYSPGALNGAEVCVLMFAESQPAYKPSQPDWMLSNLYTQPAFINPLRDATNGTAHRKIFFHYLDARMDDNTLNQCSWVLCQYKIPGSAEVLAKAIKEGKATQMYTKANAMCCLGTIGGREHVKVFEPYLKDDTVVQQGFIGRGRQGTIKVKDVALAMTIHLNGKNPKDYGFTAWQVYAGQPINYGLLGFGGDEDRKKAFEKWAADAKSEPKKEEPKKPEPGKGDQKDGVKKD